MTNLKMNSLKSKKKILILGSTGMLGHQLYNFFKKKKISSKRVMQK